MTYYLSCLDLDPRPTLRGAQLWLANPYRIHQRICLAFDDPGRLLFRVEERPRPRLLVLSPGRPDWDRAFADFPAVLAGPPRLKPYEPQTAPDQRLRFLLRANPTVKRDGRRHGLFREEEQRVWLDRKGREGGFTPLVVRVEGGLNQVSARGPHRDGGRQTHFAVEYEGMLRVDDPERFTATLYNGVGSAKAYGFGLLSVGRP
jgi:CRISPR system Cascade subunit CasE